VQVKPPQNWSWSTERIRLNFYSFTCLAFSPDGKTLATGWSASPSVHLWDVATATLMLIIELKKQGATREIGSSCHLAFSPDGKKLVSANQDGTLLLWNHENLANGNQAK
jgi:WD40 repeat protein